MRRGFDPWVGKIPWSSKWKLAPIFLPGKSLGQGTLVGYSPWGHKELDMTKRQSTIYLFIFSCAASSLLCRAFSSCGELWYKGLSLWGFSCCRERALEHRLSSCGAGAQLPCGMWNLPGSGIEPTSPVLTGVFLTTRPPGKSKTRVLEDTTDM